MARPGASFPLFLSILLATARCDGPPVDDHQVRTASLAGEDLAQVQRALAQPTAERPARVIFVAIDSLNPAYIEMDRMAAGPGQPGDWLMPFVRAFVKASSHWPDARAFFPQATDMNHLSVLSSTHSGTHGIVGVSEQPAGWSNEKLELSPIHLDRARYPDGSPVQTLFDRLEQQTAGQATTAFVSNKGWVAEQYGASASRPAAVDLVVNGHKIPAELDLDPPRYLSFHDNPLTDEDHACDPESFFQTWLLDALARKDPAEHPRDLWIARAALELIDTRQPEMMYVLLGDLDHGQHFLGAVADPSEWVAGPMPRLPAGCEPKPHYRLVSRRNPRLYKEPVLDLIRDVDLAFGYLLLNLARRGLLEDTAIVLVSDHNMINYLYRQGLLEQTDAKAILEAAGIEVDERNFSLYGAGSLGLLYWRPEYKAAHPGVVQRARDLLRAHRAQHPVGVAVSPWGVMDRGDMVRGRPDLGIAPLELYHRYFVEQDLWPDLALVMKQNWQLPSGAFNIGQDLELVVFNAGHGAPSTARVMVGIHGLGFPAARSCREPARLADVGSTVADRLGLSLPLEVGHPLSCP